jgi:hypothetical protein
MESLNDPKIPYMEDGDSNKRIEQLKKKYLIKIIKTSQGDIVLKKLKPKKYNNKKKHTRQIITI